jgi:hypothetical protein
MAIVEGPPLGELVTFLEPEQLANATIRRRYRDRRRAL